MTSQSSTELKKAIEELIPFLSANRVDLREVAVEGLMSLSTDISGRKELTNFKFLPALIRLFGDNKKIATNSLITLLNLSTETHFVNEMLETSLIGTLIHMLKDPETKDLEYCIKILVNLSREVKGCEKLLQKGEPLKGFYIGKLVDLFVFAQKLPEDPLGWIAVILMNITQLKEGREMLMDKGKNILPLILPFSKDSNIIRKRGVLGAVRNCCFEKNEVIWLLNEVDVIPFLLYPIRGPNPLNEQDKKGLERSLHTPKKFDDDIETCQLVVDALLLLAATKEARDIMREKKVYPILRDYHKQSLNEEIKDQIHQLVEYLMLMEEEQQDKSNNNNNLEVQMTDSQSSPQISSSSPIINFLGNKTPEPMKTLLPIKSSRVEELDDDGQVIQKQEEKSEKKSEDPKDKIRPMFDDPSDDEIELDIEEI